MTATSPRSGPIRRLVLLIATLALIAVACGGSSATEAETTAAPAGDPAETVAPPTPAPESEIPSVSGMTAIDGSLIEFNDLLGQDTVLWFWAPW